MRLKACNSRGRDNGYPTGWMEAGDCERAWHQADACRVYVLRCVGTRGGRCGVEQSVEHHADGARCDGVQLCGRTELPDTAAGHSGYDSDSPERTVWQYPPSAGGGNELDGDGAG